MNDDLDGGNRQAISGGYAFYQRIQDRFRQQNENDGDWLAAVDLAAEIGYRVLTIAAVSKYNGQLLWARTTMGQQWVERYDEKGYVKYDPFVNHMQSSNEHILMDCSAPIDPKRSEVSQQLQRDAQKMGFRFFRGIPFNWPTQTVYRIATFGLLEKQTESETPQMIEQACMLAEVLSTRITAPGEMVSCGAIWPPKPMLSDRERELLYFLAVGLKNDRIAERTGLAEVTVRKHLQNARQKLGATTREQALAIALQNGLLRF